MRRYLCPLSILGLAMILGVGCQPLDDAMNSVSQKLGRGLAESLVKQALEKGRGQKVEVELEKAGFGFKDAKSGRLFKMGEDVTWPTAFPLDVPRYPNGKLASISLDPDKGTSAYIMETADRLPLVAAWYREAAQRLGWKMSVAYENQLAVTLGYEMSQKGSRLELVISLTAHSADGKITITVSRNIKK